MNLLFIGPTYVGDAAIASGLLDHLLKQYPGARVTVVSGPVAAQLFAAVPNLERVVPLRKRGVIGHWLDLWRMFVGTSWDVIVDLRGSGLAWFLRARRRHVFRRRRAGHRSQVLAATLGLADLPAPVVWTSAADEQAARQAIPPGPPVLALGPTGNWPPKLWPAGRFAELALRLTGRPGPLHRGRIAVIAAEQERAIVAPLLAALPPERTIDLVGRLSLTGVTAALGHARLYVGNDSGPLFLAVAAGIPAVALFGPTPDMFGPRRGEIAAPWAPKVATVRSPESAAMVRDEVIHGPQATELMNSLTVDMVEAAALRLLARLDGAAPAHGTGS